MTKKTLFRAVAIASAVALALFPSGVYAQQANPLSVTLDPAQTAVHWTLNTTLHTVHGTFRLQSGDLRINPATGEASGRIVVDAGSGESSDAARDRRMHGDILEIGSFPEITYRPSHVSGRIDLTAPGDVTVDGIFRLHGTDHPLQMLIHLQPEGSRIRLSTRFTIPFVAWGLKDPSTFVFRTDKQVAIDIATVFAAAPEGIAKTIPREAELHPAQ